MIVSATTRLASRPRQARPRRHDTLGQGATGRATASCSRQSASTNPACQLQISTRNLKSRISDPQSRISNPRSQISHLKSQISNSQFQIASAPRRHFRLPTLHQTTASEHPAAEHQCPPGLQGHGARRSRGHHIAVSSSPDNKNIAPYTPTGCNTLCAREAASVRSSQTRSGVVMPEDFAGGASPAGEDLSPRLAQTHTMPEPPAILEPHLRVIVHKREKSAA